MRVVVAPDKFKGSLDAAAVAAAIAAGVRDVIPAASCELVPMADGGDGTVDAFLASGATPRTVRVTGPLGDPVHATYARDGDLAIIDGFFVNGTARMVAATAMLIRRFQSGYIYHYAFTMIVGVFILMSFWLYGS